MFRVELYPAGRDVAAYEGGPYDSRRAAAVDAKRILRTMVGSTSSIYAQGSDEKPEGYVARDKRTAEETGRSRISYEGRAAKPARATRRNRANARRNHHLRIGERVRLARTSRLGVVVYAYPSRDWYSVQLDSGGEPQSYPGVSLISLRENPRANPGGYG